jgi:hypothetical protein
MQKHEYGRAAVVLKNKDLKIEKMPWSVDI